MVADIALGHKPPHISDGEWSAHYVEVDANARLIAAAPDLLVVAQMMLETDNEWKALSLDERSRVEAAIAKALGEGQ